jgi:hypothetical protein
VLRNGATGCVVAATDMSQAITRFSSAVVLGNGNSLGSSVGVALEEISETSIVNGDVLVDVNSINEKENIVQAEVKQNNDDKLKGIGGWLIFPAIGLILGPVIDVIALYTSIGMYNDVARAGYGGVYSLELIVIFAFLLFTIYAAIQFFNKTRNAPKVMITLLVVSIGTSLLLLGNESSAGAEVFAVETGKQLVRDIVAAAIWIPYFNISKRVKATFVN